jgi:hypothetical protein
MHQDSLTLRPSQSHILNPDATIEQTGAIDNFPSIAEEGNTIDKDSHNDPLDDVSSSSDNDHQSNELSPDNDWNDNDDDSAIPQFETALEELDDISPQPISSAAPLH